MDTRHSSGTQQIYDNSAQNHFYCFSVGDHITLQSFTNCQNFYHNLTCTVIISVDGCKFAMNSALVVVIDPQICQVCAAENLQP